MRSLPKSFIAEKWVVNSSPIIALGRVGQVELLARLPQQIIVPQAVKEELLNAPQGDPARAAMESGLFEIIETPPPPPEILAWDLGKGETAVLSYALSAPDWVANFGRWRSTALRAEFIHSADGHPGGGHPRKTKGLDRIRRTGIASPAK